ncbi:MAG: TetR/AcrR family transcriptional regulator [Bdellovibrionales bacterium]
MKLNNRQRILDASIELFNGSGTIVITTNHIARHLKISPGNLYFHFSDREEIVRELFKRLCDETYAAWDVKTGLDPQKFLAQSFEVFWKYRFFHREMYHLRRQDPQLTREWKRHMRRCFSLLKLNYKQWYDSGYVRRIDDAWEMRSLCDSVLLTSSAYLGFFESPEKPATRKSVRSGIEQVYRLLTPYINPNAALELN